MQMAPQQGVKRPRASMSAWATGDHEIDRPNPRRHSVNESSKRAFSVDHRRREPENARAHPAHSTIDP
jgi:hypothetical protein